jgi:hypothetical protein
MRSRHNAVPLSSRIGSAVLGSGFAIPQRAANDVSVVRPGGGMLIARFPDPAKVAKRTESV